MIKKSFPVFSIIGEGSTGGGSSAMMRPRPGGSVGNNTVFEKAAGGVDKVFEKLMEATATFEAGDQTPGDAVRLQAAAQTLAFVSTATATTINSYSDSLEILAKKQ